MLKRSGALSLSLVAASLLFTGTSCQTGNGMSNNNGFIKIFDGKTLQGWEGDSVHWRAENGILIGEVTPSTLLKTNNFLIWKGGQPANFELTCEFRITEGGNSGINYRSVRVENVPHALKGYQADIDGANHYTGQNYEERGRTTLAYRGQKTTIPPTKLSLQEGVKNNAWSAAVVTGSLGSSDSLQTLIKKEDWNKCRLVIRGNRLQHYINGILMSDVTDNDKVNGKALGLLGLQCHVGPPMKVEYRNMLLRKL
ncbi:DUF1080 domain-containing protein [Chitinophaga sp. 212800010-3]|uniref:3-keto-disaccharide hydrolase n=1 Tax=unclassified Chitinophaga TaxID=2619133 RepID=UPI002DF177B1|nr:3keto-disac-hyd domain-containing protein [Chitinophaga sp. 212800010-3]